MFVGSAGHLTAEAGRETGKDEWCSHGAAAALLLPAELGFKAVPACPRADTSHQHREGPHLAARYGVLRVSSFSVRDVRLKN